MPQIQQFHIIYAKLLLGRLKPPDDVEEHEALTALIAVGEKLADGSHMVERASPLRGENNGAVNNPALTKTKLLGCPFCGASPHQGWMKARKGGCSLHGEPFDPDFAVWCPKGHAKIENWNKERVVEWWNTRAMIAAATSQPSPPQDNVVG